jgi:hypothetical protein
MTTPTMTKLTIWEGLGLLIHLRDFANAATHQNATMEIAASPKVACVQAITPAQCVPLGIAIKKGICHISQMKFRKNEKTATLSSGISIIFDCDCICISLVPFGLTPKVYSQTSRNKLKIYSAITKYSKQISNI